MSPFLNFDTPDTPDSPASPQPVAKPAMSAPSTPRTFNDLPDELVKQILGSLTAHRDLSAMCLVNRRVNHLADPLLHKTLKFDQPKHHFTFSESLTRRPRRGSAIQTVHLEYPSHELDEFLDLANSPVFSNRIDPFSHTISTMSNLENLVISVPESLCHGIGTLFNGPFDLACLKSCSLFYQREDDGYWDLQENIHIFSHPTLESLTIRRGRLDSKGFDSLEKPAQTVLEALHLIECDINDDALADLLLIPEALKEIVITQLEVPEPPLEESAEDMEDYIFALSSAQHSLETISIDFASLTGASALRMREFETLKSFELRDYQLFGQSSPRLHSVGLPPNLEILKFLNNVGEDEEIEELLCYMIENKQIMARSLREMVIVEGEKGVNPKVLEACNAAPDLHLDIW
ncbi:hypothetical protein G7Y89_g14955 [Cudoniella acicularis]|uniref:F-box domain-containing protein n=1 Tax=Cudoniella acicularis TaxID=354080 RepID=A0A8H4QVN5_9HELO|nr:hypothetical protein G7Y89_g14955 [Cudoniella acicularis]